MVTRTAMLAQLSEIGLWLDSYDDIFSDFDPRPYSERALSDDFLHAARKASRDKVSGQIELKFLIPAKLRNQAYETIIAKRLRQYFRKHATEEYRGFQKTTRRALWFIILGITIMLFAAFILYTYPEKNLFFSFLIILSEPAGWFFFWEGSHILLFDSKRPEVDFLRKMANVEISFVPY